ncbi:DUF2690 domain-containing protein [Streptacidiphilus sp. EB129]|uniref:helix-turn-helix domain-containing protein n=1 Tax=Streptacidiphilus sp. EB129 TaxID=3156262 RepID=UPI00351453C8
MSEIPPECRRLAAELRALRVRCGMSLAALGAESAYSKSSWERYLNGKALPPWPAVRTLCRLADEPEPRVRALWELSESAWSGRAAVSRAARPEPAPAVAPEPGTSPAPPAGVAADAAEVPPAQAQASAPPAAARSWRPRWSRVGLAVAVAIACAALTAGAAFEWQDAHRGSSAQSPASTSSHDGFHVGCTGAACGGLDPQAALCGVQPQTLADFRTTTGAVLEIRYNPLCRAAWARTWNTGIGDRIAISAPGESTRSVDVRDLAASERFLYTPMIPVAGTGTVLTACLTPHGSRPQCFTTGSP